MKFSKTSQAWALLCTLMVAALLMVVERPLLQAQDRAPVQVEDSDKASDDDKDEKKLPDPRKVLADPDFVAPSEKLVESLKKDLAKNKDAPLADAWSRLLMRKEDVERMPRIMREMAPPPFGSTKPAKSERRGFRESPISAVMPAWACMRTAALLQSGYPYDTLMKVELDTLFEVPVTNHRNWSQAIAEMLVLDRIIEHKDKDIKSMSKAAQARAKALAALLPWTAKVEEQQEENVGNGIVVRHGPDANIDTILELLAVNIVLEKGWGKPTCDREGLGKLLVATLVDDSGTLALFSDQNFRSSEGMVWALAMALAGEIGSSKLTTDLKTCKARLMTRGLARAEECSGAEAGLLVSFGKEAFSINTGKLAKRCLLTSAEIVDNAEYAGEGVVKLLGLSYERHAERHGELYGCMLLDPAVVSLATMGAFGGLRDPGRLKTDAAALRKFEALAEDLVTIRLPGMPHSLESAINRSLDYAVRWLRTQQMPDGQFPGEYGKTMGGQALMILAMLDAGVARDDPAIKRGIDAMYRIQGEMFTASYEYAVILMMFQKFYEKEQEETGVLKATNGRVYAKATASVWSKIAARDRDLIAKMVGLLAKKPHGNGWDYDGPRTTSDSFDNSVSQYGVLGLKAASLLGASFDRKLFFGEAVRLVRQFTVNTEITEFDVEVTAEDLGRNQPGAEGDQDDKKEGDGPAAIHKARAGGWSYASPKSYDMTFCAAGISSLAICRDELVLDGNLNDALLTDIRLKSVGAIRQMGEEFADNLNSSSFGSMSSNDGWGEFYDLYSVERACVLSNTELLHGDLDWYAHGAYHILCSQAADGHWLDSNNSNFFFAISEPRFVNVAFRILFLKRAAVHTNTGRRLPVTHAREKKAGGEEPAKDAPAKEGGQDDAEGSKEAPAEKGAENPKGNEGR